MTRPPDIKDIDKEIEAIKAQKEAAIKAQDFEKAASLRDTEKQAKERKDTGPQRLGEKARREGDLRHRRRHPDRHQQVDWSAAAPHGAGGH
jgi:ATP-dependent Clp protease ATP-binding subunit ClpC